MSTNYNILLKSENKLIGLILDYLSLVYEIHRKLWKDAEKYASTEESRLIFDNSERRIKRSIALQDELLDECIWTISKDDPRANHLRFIISIIYSTKDLFRACEYSQSIAKIIFRNKLSVDIIKGLKKTSNLFLEHLEQIIKIYKGTSKEKVEKYNEISAIFDNKIEELQKESSNQYEHDAIIQYQVMQIYRLILSTNERIESVFSAIAFYFKRKDAGKTEETKFKNK